MTQDSKRLVRQLFSDRPFMALVTLLVVLALAFCIYVFASTQQSSVQVHTRYTSIGEAHYYKSQWYYLYSFAAFGLVSTALNVLCMLRLLANQRRDFAMGLGVVAFIILVVTFAYSYNVMQIAHI